MKFQFLIPADDTDIADRGWLPSWGYSSQLHPRTPWITLDTCNRRSAIRSMEVSRMDRSSPRRNHRPMIIIPVSPALKDCSMDLVKTTVFSTALFRWDKSFFTIIRTHIGLKNFTASEYIYIPLYLYIFFKLLPLNKFYINSSFDLIMWDKMKKEVPIKKYILIYEIILSKIDNYS